MLLCDTLKFLTSFTSVCRMSVLENKTTARASRVEQCRTQADTIRDYARTNAAAKKQCAKQVTSEIVIDHPRGSSSLLKF